MCEDAQAVGVADFWPSPRPATFDDLPTRILVCRECADAEDFDLDDLPSDPDTCAACQAYPKRNSTNYPYLCDYCADEAAYGDHVNRQIDEAREARYDHR